MTPKLIGIAGPLKATVFPLGEGEVSVGREASNQLSLNDLSVSRRHCLITREGEGHKIVDLESHNGTYVNDAPAKECLLRHGDRVRVGNSLFLYTLDEPGAAGASADSSEVRLEDTALVTAAFRFRYDDELDLMARDLGALMRISAALNSACGPEALQRELLAQIFQVVPAERGAILLLGGDGEEFADVFGAQRDAEVAAAVGGGAIRVSRTVVRQVVGEGAALMSNDVITGGEIDASESLVASGVRSLLCAPLLLLGKAIGVVYLDACAPGVRFDEGHLKLVAAIAGVAAGALDAARRVERLEGENRLLRDDLDIEHNLIGESPRMRDVYRLIARVAPADSNVLVEGESGTGKELVARAVHRNGPRASKPFVAVNCAALTETLLESELFGHEKGAFTGAYAQKRGKLEVADGGTVFLDEVGEMSPPIQTKLLRVLQEREFERVGGTRTVKVDIRVLAATNKDLEEAIRQGTFRRDLYYRLNVVSLKLPPLRDRREDIPVLADYFAAKYAAKCKRRIDAVSAAAQARLCAYDWPGNVRELENAIERAVVMGASTTILPDDLPEALLEASPAPGAAPLKYYEAVTEAKRQIVSGALEQSGGDYAEAARLLGIHPNNLHRLIRNLGLKTRPPR